MKYTKYYSQMIFHLLRRQQDVTLTTRYRSIRLIKRKPGKNNRISKFFSRNNVSTFSTKKEEEEAKTCNPWTNGTTITFHFTFCVQTFFFSFILLDSKIQFAAFSLQVSWRQNIFRCSKMYLQNHTIGF